MLLTLRGRGGVGGKEQKSISNEVEINFALKSSPMLAATPRSL